MLKYGLTGLSLFFAALPSTTNYQLNSYNFGSGGTANSYTSTYSIEGSSGEIDGQPASTANYGVNPGFIQVEQANLPTIASMDNNGGLDYNKLHFVLDNTQKNPSSTLYLIAVSTSNTYVSGTKDFVGQQYLNPDGTLSSALNISQYQTYAAWGGAAGSQIIGLQAGTTYYVHVKATQGNKTETDFGPTYSPAVATASQTLTFSLVTSNQSSPPFSINLGTLYAGAVNTSSQSVNTTFTTNGASGGDVYVSAQNGGLLSSSTGYKISAVTNDLATLSEGFGAQNSALSQTSGGPYSVVSPYNGSGTTVGTIDPTVRSLYTSSGPITGGSAALIFKAKSATTDVAATDYQDVLTFTAAGNF